jgi:hypothetical protein
MYEAINAPSSPENVDSFCLAFVWMECALMDVKTVSYKRDPVFYKNVASAVLGTLHEFKLQQLVHICALRLVRKRTH